MRDLLLVTVFFVLWLLCFRRPYIGPLLWSWISMMSPHRLTYGFAYSMPFAQITAVTSLLVFIITKKKFPFPRNLPATLLLVFFLWCSITSLTSFNTPAVVFDMWMKVAKIQIMLFITMMLIGGRHQINLLIAVLSLSVAFYGVKGGIYTLAHGGSGMVWGPAGSFIEGTNHLALAFVMVVPLIYYLLGEQRNVWYRRILIAVIALTILATLGTYSRGAFLAAITMAFFLGMKSKRKVLTLGIMTSLLVGAIVFLPDKWSDKMSTISTHEDHSAQSRIYTWKMIWNLAMHHPLTGGGYNVTENPITWQLYAVTEYAKAYSPHSIYFQALAEHGFIGLFLYLAIGIATWRYASKTAKLTRDGPDKDWAPQLMRMIQVALMGFAVGGFFVNLVNFDLPYYLVAIVTMVGRDTMNVALPMNKEPLAYGVASR